MPNIGSFDASVNLDFRKADAQARRFQQTLQKGFSRNGLGRASADARDFEKTLGAATNRVVAFGAAAVVFNTLSRSVGAFAASIVEVDKALAEINVNLNQSASGLKAFSSELFNVSRQTGQTFETAAKAAAELARQGLSAEETIKRLKDALILSRISGLGAADSVNALTAAINSFNKEALTSSEVVNKFAAVDTKFAVSSKDLAEGMSRVGSTAQAAGVGVDELIGLITSLQQTTQRGGTTIGNGLKTIFTRLQSAPQTVSALQSVGVAIKDTSGNLRSAIDILRDYGRARERFGEAERQSLDRTIAGTFQINVLKAALADLAKGYSVYDNALSASVNATDEAIRKNEQLNQTLSSLINQTGLSLKQLVASIGEQDLAPVLKGLLQFVETARKYLSEGEGETLGKTLGTGLLRGIANVLSGPGLVAVSLVLFSVFRKIFSTIASEAQALFKIGGILNARVRAQERIEVLARSATAQEYSQLQAARSVVAQKEVLLAIQQRINRELLIGTELQNAFVGPGVLPRTFSVSKGVRPGFADPLASAINKEARVSGLPKSQIYVDRDPRVANFANPSGILVANKRDEPLGGYQGVNRVIAQGGNPKVGSIPGFAAPVTLNQLKNKGQFTSNALLGDINRLLKSLEGLDRGRIKGVVKELDALTTGFNKSAKNLVQLRVASLQASAKRGEGRIVNDNSRRASDEDIANSQRPIPGGIPGSPYNTGSSRTTIPPRGPMTREQYRAIQVRNARYQGQQLFQGDPERLESIRNQNERLSTLGPQLSASVARKKANATAANAARKTQRFQRVAFGAALALPFLSGFIPEGQGGTKSGIAGGFASGAARGASLGVFGPGGLALGVVVGGLVGAFSKLKKSTEELDAELGDAKASRSKRTGELSQFIDLQQSLDEALDSGNLSQASKISSQQDSFLRSASPETKELIAKVGTSLSALEKAQQEQSKKFGKDDTAGEFQSALAKFSGTTLSKALGTKPSDSATKDLASAIAAQANSRGVAIPDVKGISTESGEFDPVRFKTINDFLKSLGNKEYVSATDQLVKALQMAKEESVKAAAATAANVKNLKEYQVTVIKFNSLLKSASLFAGLGALGGAGRRERGLNRESADADVLSGLASNGQKADLRGRLDVSRRVAGAADQKTALDDQFKDDLRKSLKGVFDKLKPSQKSEIFDPQISISDLEKSVKKLLPGNEDLESTIRDYNVALELNKKALVVDTDNILDKTRKDKEASELIRRQAAFSGGSLERGSDAARGLSVIGREGERTPRKQAAENSAFSEFFEQQTSLLGDTSALQGRYNESAAKTNLEKFLAEAETTLRSLTGGQARARDDSGNLSANAVRTAAGTLSRYRDPTKASVGKYILQNLDAQQQNVKDAASGQSRIGDTLKKPVSLNPEELLDKQVAATLKLQDTLNVFNEKSTEFTINLNTKLEVVGTGIDNMQGDNFKQEVTDALKGIVDRMMNMSGKPNPPSRAAIIPRSPAPQ